VYVREIGEDYVRILALESVRNRVIVIGEDLGTVESSIQESLARFGILSYRVFYFEKDKRGNFRAREEYPAQALVSSTTHDLPTLAGFWVGTDIHARLAAGLLDEETFPRHMQTRQEEKQKMLDLLFGLGMLPGWVPRRVAEIPELTGELHNAIIGFLATTPCQLLAVNQEDVTKELEQQNLPGSTSQYPNWCRKMRFSVEQLRSGDQVGPFAGMFRNWIVNSGRGNQPG